MTRPHEALGLKQPVGRRLPQGISGWNLGLAVLSIGLIGMYIIVVNGAAAKSYQLQAKQRQVEALQTDATILQNAYVAQTSLHTLSAQATQQGFVPVDHITYLNPNPTAYAMR